MEKIFKNRLWIFWVCFWVVNVSVTAIGSTGPMSKFSLTYHVAVTDVPAGGGVLKVWTPFPSNCEEQSILDVTLDAPSGVSVNYDTEWGNGIFYFLVNDPKPFQYSITYLVERRESKLSGFDYTSPLTLNNGSGPFSRYLRPSAYAVINESVKQYAAEATQNKANALAMVRGVYDFIFSQLRYDKSLPGWGRGDVGRLCFLLDEGKQGKGNCTDFHSLFTSMLQVLGVPVKFEMGYPLKTGRNQLEPRAGGYHCWAKFFIAGYGWIPVDISEASKAPEKKEYFWGGIDAYRIRFSTGRDILLSPPQQGERLNFFGPDPHMELDGAPFKGFSRSISYRFVK